MTLFAPSNEAFRAIGSAVESLTPQQLSTVLSYHVIAGTVAFSPLIAQGLANESLATVEGGSVELTVEGDGSGRVFVDEGEVVIRDVIVANGVLHVIDKCVPLSSSPLPPLPPSFPSLSFFYPSPIHQSICSQILKWGRMILIY